MFGKPYTPHQSPRSTGRRASIDQDRPTDRSRTSRLNVFKKSFGSSKHEENKRQDVNRDNTSDNDHNEKIQTNEDQLPTDPTPNHKMRQNSLPSNGPLASPSRPSYPHNDSGFSGASTGDQPKAELSTTGREIPPLAAGHVHLPPLKGVGGESIGVGSLLSSNGAHASQTKVPQDKFGADNDRKESDLGPESLPKDNHLPTFGDLVNENRLLKKRLNEAHEAIGNLTLQRDNAENKIGFLNREIARVAGERDEAERKHAEVHGQYNNTLTDLDNQAIKLRKAIKDLEDGEAKWNSETEHERQLRDHISALKREIDDKDEAWKKFLAKAEAIGAERDKLKIIQGQFKDLEMSLNQTLGQLQDRNEQLLNVREDYETEKRKHSEVSTELMRIKIESRSDVDDAFFTKRYQNLQTDIRTWAQTYFWGEQRKRGKLQSPHNLKQHPSIHDDLEELSEDCLDLLAGSDDGSTRPFVAEAYVWKFIEDKIFHSSRSISSCSKGLFWAHKLRPEMARMEKFLYPAGPGTSDSELRMFYKWKANTAKLVIRRLRPIIERTRIPVDPTVMSYMITQVLHVLEGWMTKDEKPARFEKECRMGLATILQAAIDFDSYIHEEWSWIFTIATPSGFENRYGFPFDERLMKSGSDYPLLQAEPVGIVLSPALVRIGTPSGDFYSEVQEILVPSRVLPEGFWAKTQKSNNARNGGVMRGVQQRIRA